MKCICIQNRHTSMNKNISLWSHDLVHCALEKRLDKYSVARDSKFTKNRFRAHKLTRARHTIGAKDKREVTSQKILKISFENIVAKLNK